MADPGMFSVRRQVSLVCDPLSSHLLTTRADSRTSKQQLLRDSHARFRHEALELHQQHEPTPIPSESCPVEEWE